MPATQGAAGHPAAVGFRLGPAKTGRGQIAALGLNAPQVLSGSNDPRPVHSRGLRQHQGG